MAGRLNTFQKAMLQWNDIHPYNAVHIVKLPQRLDKERLRDVITREISDLGLSGFSLDRRQSSYAFTGGDEGIEIRFMLADAEDRSLLSREVEAELNRPFPDTISSPFRFFAVQRSESFHLGLVYFHAIAGAESIALLLRSIVQKYLEQEGSTFSLPLDLYPKHSGLKSIRPSLLTGQLLQIVRQLANLRRSCRPRHRKGEDYWNAYTRFVISQEQFQRIAATAKRWGVTLNDLFLALILQSVAPLAESRFKAKRRRQISAASIANIRKDLKVDASKTFGLFLGSFSVSHEVPKGISLETLASEIKQQTNAIKHYRSYLLSPLELKAAGLFMPMLSLHRRARFYARNYPLWAGITNMNLNTVWPMKQGEGPVDYLRGVSTGPITPCVFAITTVGEKVSIGVTFRRAVYKSEDMEGIINRFLLAIEDQEVHL